jgi:hypothetical protein
MIKYSSPKPKQEFILNQHKTRDVAHCRKLTLVLSNDDYNLLVEKAGQDGFSAYGIVKALVQNFINED